MFLFVSLWLSYSLALSLCLSVCLSVSPLHFSLYEKSLGNMICSVFQPILLFWFTCPGESICLWDCPSRWFWSGALQAALRDIGLEMEIPRALAVGLLHMSNTSYAHKVNYRSSVVNKMQTFHEYFAWLVFFPYASLAWPFRFYPHFHHFQHFFPSHSDLLLLWHLEPTKLSNFYVYYPDYFF